MPNINHAERAHARLSASGAHRWLNCPPSVRATEHIPEGPPSVYAEEGTFAHELSELYFAKDYEGMSEDEFKTRFYEMTQNKYFSEELREYVESYVNIVAEHFSEHTTRGNVTAMFETRLDLSAYVPNSFGTGDVILASQGVIEIIDLKYGKGVEVSAINNPQLRLYGLGAYELLSMFEDFEEVRMTIVQPRLDNISTEILTVDELVAWGNNTVKPQADKAEKGIGAFNPGPWCKFCPIRAVCRARVEAMTLTAGAMDKPDTLTNNELAELLYKIPEIKTWAEDVHAYALQKVEDGTTLNGWKLVEGRKRRKFIDETEALEALKAKKFRVKDVTETKLKSITKLEKEFGKKQVADVLGEHITKADGKPTLAPQSDKRPALTLHTAQDDFKNL
ncbi:DUF2800 domain-containing protein [Staphylococcus chromogenes]|uniref:DUF2800 domain-containing protein n=1 Tax=Staphylococcus chromogenes TaxID=46126 RepID=UPI003B00D2B7